MGCPYLEAMEEAGVKDLLFSSGEARLRLLCWFTGRYAIINVRELRERYMYIHGNTYYDIHTYMYLYLSDVDLPTYIHVHV
jgi:hypothetical protein